MRFNMRILLLAMPDLSPWVPENAWHLPSLANESLAANINSHHIVFSADLNRKRSDVKGAVDKLLSQYKPQLVGLTAMSYQYPTARKIAAYIKSINSSIITVLGGYHATMWGHHIISSSDRLWWDFIVKGEGEETFDELLNSIEGKKNYDEIKGISYKIPDDPDHIFKSNPPRELLPLERIKIPNRDARVYGGHHFMFHPADIIETSRGCKLACNFCSIHKVYGSNFRAYSIERVIEDLKDVAKRNNSNVFVSDDHITQDVPRFEALCDAIAADKKLRKLRFTLQTSVVGINSSTTLASKMRKAGFNIIFLGIESVSRQNLRAMNKGDIIEESKEAVRRLKSNNIIVIGGMITGMPEDNIEDIYENFHFFKEIGCDTVLDQVICPYPSTKIRDELTEKKLITNYDDFRWYNGYWPNVGTSYLTTQELQWHRWRAKRVAFGIWKPSKAYFSDYPIYSMFWLGFLMPSIWMNERILHLLFGEKGRYKKQIGAWRAQNEFNLPEPISYLESIEKEKIEGIGNLNNKIKYSAVK